MRLERLLLFLLVLFLPSQLGIHFWPSWSLLNGLRIDYLSPTLYLTDLIVVGLLFISPPVMKLPLPVFVFAVLNIAFSLSPLNSLFFWFRALELLFLFRYLSVEFAWKSKIVNWSLSAAVVWTCFLTWFQFFLQRSLNGPFYWLGERMFDISTPGIATMSILGHLVLRPYATLPHPNALAGFLLVSTFILNYLNSSKKLPLIIAAITLPLTFSRSAILVEIVVLLILGLRKLKIKIGFQILVLLLASAFYVFFSLYLGDPGSATERLALINKSITIIRAYPLFGVGLGNFIIASVNSFITFNYRIYSQPVHNIYLLIVSELGLPAGLFIFYSIFKSLKHLLVIGNWLLFIPVVSVIITGLTDHYWFTLHQNQLLLVLLFVLVHAQMSKTNINGKR